MSDPEKPNPDPHEGWVDRRWSVPKEVWDQILEMAAQSGIHYAELVVILVEEGIAVKMREPLERNKPPPLPPHPFTSVRIEGPDDRLIAKRDLRQVPAPGEILTLEGRNYVVDQRAWGLAEEVVAYLRVSPWPRPTS